MKYHYIDQIRKEAKFPESVLYNLPQNKFKM